MKQKHIGAKVEGKLLHSLDALARLAHTLQELPQVSCQVAFFVSGLFGHN
jgi:hypothetical protein